jgi:tRNA A37 threonylcarbamoyltransferase TsaD
VADYLHATIPLCDIDADALDMFLGFAKASARSGGEPMVETHTLAGRVEAAMLQQLKRAGLLATIISGGHQIIRFTGAGRCLARDYGVDIPR